MAVNVQSLGIENITQEEKIALIDELWADVVASSEAIPGASEMRAELDRRISEYEADPSSALSWDEVRESARKRIGE